MEGDGENGSFGDGTAGSPDSAQTEAAVATEATTTETETAIDVGKEASPTAPSTENETSTVSTAQVSALSTVAGLLGLGPVAMGLGLVSMGMRASDALGGLLGPATESSSSTAAATNSAAGRSGGADYLFADSGTVTDPLEELRRDYLRYTTNQQGA